MITLTTDFGSRDGFVGVMKGVILSRAPRARIVDLAHDLPRGDVRAAALVLMTSCPFFPRGTIHVAVVDPGVGTGRAAVAVRSGGQFFVGPDNGVLSWAAGRDVEVVDLEHSPCRLRPVSRTFHGRDIFAPAAAALARGLPLAGLGRRRRVLVELPYPAPRDDARGVNGNVLGIDRFGNALTTIVEAACRRRWGARRLAAWAGGRRLPVVDAYGRVARGEPLAIFGSSGRLELSVRDGRADRLPGVRRGARVRVGPAR